MLKMEVAKYKLGDQINKLRALLKKEDELEDAPHVCKVCGTKTFQYDKICSFDCEKVLKW